MRLAKDGKMSNNLDSCQDLPIDYSEVLERIGGDELFLEELLKIYFEEFSGKIALLREAIEQGNFTLIQELGHGLKGASANLSLASLKKTCFALELSGREKNIEQARSAFLCLGREFQRLKNYLESSPLRSRAGQRLDK
jgi:HPt (histidine-containing phosphotransfer) domain-containing protein